MSFRHQVCVAALLICLCASPAAQADDLQNAKRALFRAYQDAIAQASTPEDAKLLEEEMWAFVEATGGKRPAQADAEPAPEQSPEEEPTEAEQVADLLYTLQEELNDGFRQAAEQPTQATKDQAYQELAESFTREFERKRIGRITLTFKVKDVKSGSKGFYATVDRALELPDSVPVGGLPTFVMLDGMRDEDAIKLRPGDLVRVSGTLKLVVSNRSGSGFRVFGRQDYNPSFGNRKTYTFELTRPRYEYPDVSGR